MCCYTSVKPILDMMKSILYFTLLECACFCACVEFVFVNLTKTVRGIGASSCVT